MLLSPIIKRALKLLPNGFHVPIPLGKMRGIKWISCSANPGQTVGRYEPLQSSLLATLLGNSNVFWDVGAHVGWYSLLASRIMNDGEVLCFEPNPVNWVFLQQHITINQADNITSFEIALGNREGQCQFSGDAQFGKLAKHGDYSVTVTTADSLIAKSGIAPDLIKLDIEGGELDFLHGAHTLLKNYYPIILLSAHGYQRRDACMSYLDGLGYQIQMVIENQQDGDYVFIAKKLKSNNRATHRVQTSRVTT
jgi:FkbM family methyltransferase